MAKIAIVATDSWYLWNFRRSTICRLIEEGHVVTVYCGNYAYLKKLEVLGARVEYVPLDGRRVRPFREFVALMFLAKKIWLDRPNALMSFNPKGNLYSGFVRGIIRFGWIANISGLGMLGEASGWKSSLIKGVFRFAFKRVDHVFFQNYADLDSWVSSGIVTKTRSSRQFGSGIDLNEFSYVSAPEAPLSVVCIARLLEKKGIGEFISLAERVRSSAPEISFLLAGAVVPIEEGGYPVEKIHAAEKASHIRFLQMLEDVRPVLAGRTLGCLLTQYKEGLPRSMIEFLATGRPILISKFDGADDLVPAAENGKIVDLGKPEWLDLASAFVLSVAKNARLYDELCNSARGIAEERYDVNVGIEEYLAQIDTVLVKTENGS